jgi:UDP-glucose 4-epimerase
LLAAGFSVMGIDNFSNSSPEVLNRLRTLSGREPEFARIDVCDAAAMDALFSRERIDAVVHFAAFKAVGESVSKPLAYYVNNIGGLLTLAQTMAAHDCKTLVFSSSATVYGRPESLPIREDAALSSTNAYGASKLISEDMLRDVMRADPQWSIALLRYFNPVGAHESGMIGEDPSGTPNNLLPFVAQVAVGRLERLQIFGNDYGTIDGTGVRDYIHVQDLANGHSDALRFLLDKKRSITANLGTGHGHSVLEVIRSFERASGVSIPFDIVDRRPGDVDACYADTSLAKELLGWEATRDLDAMCADAWRWQRMNPNGMKNDAATETTSATSAKAL